MSFNWDDYKKLAEHLYNDPDSAIPEAYYRSAISRAYYAAFHITKKKMIDHYGFISRTSNAHSRLLDFLREKKIDNPIIGEAWINLKRLRVRRESADYDDEYSYEYHDLARSSGFALSYCERVLEAISRLRSGKKQ